MEILIPSDENGKRKEKLYGFLLFFIFFPSIIICCISVRWEMPNGIGIGIALLVADAAADGLLQAMPNVT